MTKKSTELTVVPGGKKPGEVTPAVDAPKCCARKRNCDCGHRFSKDETVKSDHKLAERRQPGFNKSRLGHCPKCGITRPICQSPAVKERSVCRMHGGKAGRRPALALNKLSDQMIDRVAALMAEEDDSLTKEFFVVKAFIQETMSEFKEEMPNKMEFVERCTTLLDRAVGIQEKQAKLHLMVPPGGEMGKLDFEDPRVALLIKQKMRDSYEEAVKGTLHMIIETVGEALGGDLLQKLLVSLPERFKNYIVVEQAKEVEAEVIEHGTETEPKPEAG